MKLRCMIDIDEKIQWTYGQGHGDKGQGQTCNYEETYFRV